MQRLEVSGAARPIYGSLGVKRLILIWQMANLCCTNKNDASQSGYVKFVVLMSYIWINTGTTPMVIVFLNKKKFVKS